MARAAAPWFPYRVPRAQARIRLICFPHAGGGASTFRGWEADLGPEVDVCGVQLPGRETRWSEPLFDALDPLLAAVQEAVQPWLDLPWALFGHSLGGVVAFELARRLRGSGQGSPAHLFVSASRAPHRPRPPSNVHEASDAEFAASLARLGTVPREVLGNEELRSLVLPILRADFLVYGTYRYEPQDPLDCPISILGGEQDQLVSYADLSAWRAHTTGRSSLRLFSSGHFFLRSDRAKVLAAVREDLAHHFDGAPVFPEVESPSEESTRG